MGPLGFRRHTVSARTSAIAAFLPFVVCSLLPVVDADEGRTVEATLRLSGGVQFQGDANLTVRSFGMAFQLERNDSAFRWEASANFATVRILNFPYTVTGATGGPLAPNQVTHPLPDQKIYESEFNGTLRIVETGRDDSYRVLPRSRSSPFEFSLRGPADFELSEVREFHAADYGDNFTRGFGEYGRAAFPTGIGSNLQLPPSTPIETRGALWMLFFGATVELRSSDGQVTRFDTGEELNRTTTVSDPTGTHGMWTYDRRVLVLEGNTVELNVTIPSSARTVSAVSQVFGDWTGDLELDGVSGRVDVEEAEGPSTASLLQVVGDFEGVGDFSRQPAVWRMNGRASFVGVDGATFAGVRPGLEAVPFLGQATGAAALAAALALARYLPELLGFLYTRLHGPDVLDHPRRLRLAQFVRGHPGSTLAEAARSTGIARGVLRYHVSVLTHAGEMKRIALAGTTRLVIANGGAQPRLGEILAARDQRWGFLKDLLTDGPRNQVSVVKALQERFGVGDRRARKWIDRAVRYGLVAREGARKRAVCFLR